MFLTSQNQPVHPSIPTPDPLTPPPSPSLPESCGESGRSCTTRRTAPVQPGPNRRGDSHGSLWRPRPRQDLHFSSRTPERELAPVVQAADQADVCVQQEVGEPKGGAGAALAFYDFCRVHRALATTPAVEAGITNHTWTLDDG